jgi:hypothetical protein
MKIARIELSDFYQTFPIPDTKHGSLEIHCPRRAELQQGAIHGCDGHAECFAQLNQADRRLKSIVIRQAGCARPIEEFAKEVAHSRGHRSAAIIGYRLPKNGSIDQGFTPYRKPQRRPAIERGKQFLMGDRRNHGRADRTYGVIHSLDEKRL